VLDTPPEENFNKLAALAAKIFNMPIALISFVDSERVFFKANVGMEGTQNVERGVSFCSLAILDKDVTVVDQPLNDVCTLANPLVTGSFGLRFYAGAPIITPNGYCIGTLCIVDKKQRYITEDQKDLLADIASIVMDYVLVRAN
jgi:GAF domain-containing protein